MKKINILNIIYFLLLPITLLPVAYFLNFDWGQVLNVVLWIVFFLGSACFSFVVSKIIISAFKE